MIERGRDLPGEVAERDEVEDVVVLVESPLDLDGDPIIVAVDPLAKTSPLNVMKCPAEKTSSSFVTRTA